MGIAVLTSLLVTFFIANGLADSSSDRVYSDWRFIGQDETGSDSGRARFSVFGDWSSYKNDNLRYYYNELCEASEPPGVMPAIFDHSSAGIPSEPWLPTHNWDSRETECIHDTDPPTSPPSSDQFSPLLHIKYSKDKTYITKFRYQKLGLGHFAERAFNSPSIFDRYPLARNNDPKNPGNYYEYPYNYSASKADSTEILFLNSLLIKYLKSNYNSRDILKYIESIFLWDLGRKEFFFEANSDNTRFRFSGWYGNFAHIFVFTDFDSKSGFVEQAHKYFNLPGIDESLVSYDRSGDNGNGQTDFVNMSSYDVGGLDFFYTYEDTNANFKLCAYPLIRKKRIDEKNEFYRDGVILDLTVYPEEK